MKSKDRALSETTRCWRCVQFILVLSFLVFSFGPVQGQQPAPPQQEKQGGERPDGERPQNVAPRPPLRRIPLVPAVLKARLAQNADNGGLTIHGKLSRAELEEMLYGLLGGSRQAFRRLRRDAIQRSVDRVDQVCQLTPLQKEKIDGSIDIDIARIESKITSLLSEIRDDTAPEKKQAIYNDAWQTLRTMQQTDTLDQDALWKKVLHATLTTDQQKRLSEDEQIVEAKRERSSKFRLLLLAQRKVGLTSDERKNLLPFLLHPQNQSIQTLSDFFEALKALPAEQRDALLSEESFQAWTQQSMIHP
ncbi:hypothetical protein SH501x_002628 [Pirellulaceae bacterium SH501]